MDPKAVAQFLRSCPGLNKQTTGELLGEYDEFFLEVLRHFTETFDFTGIALGSTGIAFDFTGIAFDFTGIALKFTGIAVDAGCPCQGYRSP